MINPHAEPAERVRRRWISALVLAPVAVAVCWIGGWPFAAVISLLAAAMAYEWDRLVGRGGGALGPAVIAWAPAACAPATMVLGPGAALILLAVGFASALLFAPGGRAGRLWFALGVVYIGLPALSVMDIRLAPDFGRELALTLFFVAWASDSGAYLVGTAVGGPKLIPSLSPSKTWAGLIGAAFCGGAFALFSAVLNRVSPLLLYLFLGILIALIVQMGDLLESSLKRRFEAKDTGGLIPGHGGVMDRLDGLGFAAVVVAPVLHIIREVRLL